MPKLIDSDELLEWGKVALGSAKLWDDLKAEIESGNFDPTPVQPDTPNPGDKVRTNTAWKHLEGVVTGVSKYHAMVDFGFPVEFEIPFEHLEVIPNE